MYTHARTGGAPLAHGVVVFIGVYLEQARTHPHHRRRVFGPTMLHADGQAWQGCGFIERGRVPLQDGSQWGCSRGGRHRLCGAAAEEAAAEAGDTVSAVPLQKRLRREEGRADIGRWGIAEGLTAGRQGCRFRLKEAK